MNFHQSVPPIAGTAVWVLRYCCQSLLNNPATKQSHSTKQTYQTTTVRLYPPTCFVVVRGFTGTATEPGISSPVQGRMVTLTSRQ